MDRVTLTIVMEKGQGGHVNARRNVPVQALIDEIRRKFECEEGEYSLFLKGRDEPLEASRTLAQHGLQDGNELIFKEGAPESRSRTLAMIESGIQKRIQGRDEAYLEEERGGQIFEIAWQPALIGRAYQMNPSANKLLAADLSDLQGSEFVSRQHACIIERDGQYVIKGLNPRNPTYVNDRVLGEEEHILQPGDRVRVGKIVLIFNLRG
jgi:hypothetical protein